MTPVRFQEFKASFCRIIRNPVILSSCGSNVFTILGVYGFFIWLPKYFEHEFRVSKSTAALFSGTTTHITRISNQQHSPIQIPHPFLLPPCVPSEVYRAPSA